MMRKSSLLDYLGVLVLAAAAVSLCFGTALADDLTQSIERILASQDLAGVEVGVCIVNLASGRTVFARGEDVPLTPASNQKLFTTAAAIVTLGGDYSFRTDIYARGKMSGGVLDGDLILRGGGDPNIAARFCDGEATSVPGQWAERLKEAGLARVKGDIVVDDTLFDRQRVHPDWPRDQLDNYYCAEVSALNFNENVATVSLVPGRAEGRPVQARLDPVTSYIKVINEVRTTAFKTRNSVMFSRPGGNNTFRFSGRLFADGKPRAYAKTVRDPASYLATIFREELGAHGVAVEGSVRLTGETPGDDTRGLRLLLTHASPMAPTVVVTNLHSHNLFAECLFKLVGAERYGKGSFESGGKAVTECLRKLRIATDGFVASDGSGLAKSNRATARQIVGVLGAMYKDKNHRDLFLESLGVGGVRGRTMQKRLREEPYKGRVFGKTGYIWSVSALSGYVFSVEGRVYAFSILFNGFGNRGNARMKRLQDDVCRVLVTN